jgi:hypothetical protein
MNAVSRRFVLLPQRQLRLVAVPRTLLPGDAGIEQWLVLELVSAETPGKRVLGPNDLTPNFEGGRFQRVLKLALPRR